ncbi:MAG: protein GlmU [Desulfobacteraceae bacterium]|nr:MAG: protein GlmU [Desulfobacteraceae bacterium]
MMPKIQELINKGAIIPDPHNVLIGDEVDIGRLAGKGVALYPGTRIFGANTFISEGAQIGAEGPVTIENCHVGPQVELKGGFFTGAVFLRKAVCGLGSYVRQGTILEEEASIAHTVGLKQTILFPYVTLGSLINFCDCLMAGGTSRKNHSEVGSSYIHFNFTPNQDKATPSLMGDVPKGVMLNQSPIFLGGQGGLVGPCRLAFGTVVAAGTICRNDQLEENHLVFGTKTRSGSIPYSPGSFLGIKRIISNNIIYIGNLSALRQWYLHVRSLFTGPEMSQEILDGLHAAALNCIEERIRQLAHLSRKIGESEGSNGRQHEFVSLWPEVEDFLKRLASFEGSPKILQDFIQVIENKIQIIGKAYLGVVKSLELHESALGTQWLEGIVQQVVDGTAERLPFIGKSKSSFQ